LYPGVYFDGWGNVNFVRVPYLYAVILNVAIAGASLLRWSRRFSLRGLLIGTTILAVALGSLGYAIRK
jgi:hypothetical protein